jgi:hypothetical protein
MILGRSEPAFAFVFCAAEKGIHRHKGMTLGNECLYFRSGNG